MEPRRLGVVAYRRSFAGLVGLGACGFALTLPEIAASAVANRMWLALATCALGALVCGYFGSVRIGARPVVTGRSRRAALAGLVGMAVAFVLALSVATSLSSRTAVAAWFAAGCLGMGVSMLVRLLQARRE